MGSGRVPKFIPFSGWFLSDFSSKNDGKNDANLEVFSLFFRSAENAGNTINTMVSAVFCISESIKNYAKIDVKTQVKLIMEKVRKMIQKWIQNGSQKVQDASQFLSFFTTVFLTHFFDFWAKMWDFGSQMGMSKVKGGPYFFSLFRVWAPAGVQDRPRERRRPILTSFLMDFQWKITFVRSSYNWFLLT